MDNQHQPVMDDEQEDEYYQGTPGINHRGKSALSVVAYFALLALLMYPAHKLRLGTQGVFFAMIAAGLLLALCLLAAKWARGKLAALQLSKKGFIQLLVGYQPDTSAGAAPEPEVTTRAQSHRTNTSTGLMPQVDQHLVRYGEIVGFDEDEGELPERLIEANPLYLSDTFQPDVNNLLGATALLCGMRRSGKSNGIAVMAEELGRYYCPLCIGDSEDEYGPLADHRYLPRGQWAGSAALLQEMEQRGVSHYVAIDLNGAYAFGQAIVRDVLQVVLHLKSFESDDEAAEVMTEIIYGMHDWEASRHNRERVPCTLMLDEASKWLPQRLEESSVLDKEVLTLLHQALFGTVVRRGGKQGLGLILATQRIAELDKRALQSQWKFLFRQTEPIDIGLYTRMGLERDEIVTLRQGECFIFSPSVIGFRTLLRTRYSPHLAHTPGLSELASHLRRVRPLEVVTRHYVGVEATAADPDASQRQEASTTAPATVRSKPKTELERALAAYLENPLASYRELGEKLGVGKDKAGELVRELRERGMIEQGQA